MTQTASLVTPGLGSGIRTSRDGLRVAMSEGTVSHSVTPKVFYLMVGRRRGLCGGVCVCSHVFTLVHNTVSVMDLRMMYLLFWPCG